jgi:glutamine cyclotransferase
MMKEVSGSTRRTFGTALLIALIFFAGVCGLKPKTGMAMEPEQRELKIIESIQIPDVTPHGLVMAQQALWVVDTKERVLKKIDVKTKRVVSAVPLRVKEPRGITWDGKTFWVVDNREKAVHQIGPEKGTILRTVVVPIDFDREKALLESAAFDGKHLWVAYFAGWSSRILRMDAETGEVLQSMFAKGHPIALATDGKRLWMVSYNQGRYTGVISERTIMDDARRMNLSKKIVGRTPGKEPVGLAYDEQYLWITDRKIKAVHKVGLH